MIEMTAAADHRLSEILGESEILETLLVSLTDNPAERVDLLAMLVARFVIGFVPDQDIHKPCIEDIFGLCKAHYDWIIRTRELKRLYNN
jgi:hypothetical protein